MVVLYFKSPQSAQAFILNTTCSFNDEIKNTLRHLRGEDLITHLGLEYYD